MRSNHYRNRFNAERTVTAQRTSELRARATESESRLWSAVRARQLGVLFRRQVPIGGYIVDLVAPECRLVVEIDGGYHRKRRVADARRDAVLARLGYRVLRIRAGLVVADLAAAVQRVRSQLWQ